MLRRGTLVLLQSVGPYLAENISARQLSQNNNSVWQQNLRQRSQRLRALRTEEGIGTVQSGVQTAVDSVRQRIDELRSAASRSVQSVPGWHALARAWPLVLQALKDNAGVVTRVNLALFYVFGLYYQMTKRVTGAHLHGFDALTSAFCRQCSDALAGVRRHTVHVHRPHV